MKVVACLDSDGSPVWVSIPTKPSEIKSALRELGFEPLDDDVIDYEEDNIPDWHLVVPIWKCQDTLAQGLMAGAIK